MFADDETTFFDAASFLDDVEQTESLGAVANDKRRLRLLLESTVLVEDVPLAHVQHSQRNLLTSTDGGSLFPSVLVAEVWNLTHLDANDLVELTRVADHLDVSAVLDVCVQLIADVCRYFADRNRETVCWTVKPNPNMVCVRSRFTT